MSRPKLINKSDEALNVVPLITPPWFILNLALGWIVFAFKINTTEYDEKETIVKYLTLYLTLVTILE